MLGLTNGTKQPWLSAVCSGYAALMFTLYPLFVHNGYFDITKTKYLLYCGLTLALVLCGLLYCACRLVSARRKAGGTAPRFSLSATDAGMFCFWVSCGVSCIVSPSPANAFFGSTSRFFGFLLVSAFFAAYILLSRFAVQNQMLLFSVVIGEILVGALGVLNHFGCDPFALLDRVSPEQKNMFLSTLGNVNLFGSFFCILFPLTAVLFACSTQRTSQILYGAACAAGAGAVVCSNSDGTLLAVALSFLAASFFALRSPQRLSKFFQAALLFLLCARVIGIVQLLCPGEVHLSASSAWLCQSGAGLCLTVSAALGAVLTALWRGRAQREFLSRWWLRLWAVFVCAAVAALLLLIIYFSIVNTQAALGRLEQYLRFNDGWGTDRGYIWKRVMQAYVQLPLPQLLFGHGLDTVLPLLHASYQEMLELFSVPFDAAHNEYLQYLATTGIFGIVSYLFFLISLFVRAIRSKNRWALALAAGVFGYGVQAVFNVAQPITTPLFFCAAALTEAAVRESSGETVRREE